MALPSLKGCFGMMCSISTSISLTLPIAAGANVTASLASSLVFVAGG